MAERNFFQQFQNKFNPLILVLILALGLRLPELTSSFWLDEAAQALESIRPWSQQLELRADFQPPLLHLIVAAAARVNTAEWWLRSFGALIPGLISILGTYLIGRRLKNEKVGLIASLLIATSSFHIFYSQELRPYALPTMWAVLSWWFLLRANTETKTNAKIKTQSFNSNWWLFAISSLLGFYSSYLYPFLWLGQVTWLLWQHREQFSKFLISSLLVILGFTPWLPSFFEQLEAGTAVRENLPGWAEVVSISQSKALPLVFGKFLFGVIDLELNPVFIVTTLIIAVLIGLILHQNRPQLSKKTTRKKNCLLSAWLLLPTLTAWLVSFWIPVVRPKRLLLVMPAFYLSLASLISLAKDKLSQHLSNFLLFLLIGLNLFGFWRYSLENRYQRENWRALHQTISQNYPINETLLLFSFPEPFAPWRWYDQGRYPTLSTGQLKLTTGPSLTEKIKPVAEYRYVLLFDYLRDLTDPEDQLRTELWALGFREIRTLDSPGIGFVRVFSRDKITAKK